MSDLQVKINATQNERNRVVNTRVKKIEDRLTKIEKAINFLLDEVKSINDNLADGVPCGDPYVYYDEHYIREDDNT